jgi:murein DD-endopeptidase MepM/ murein hydrolase activator NlpD
VLAPVGGVVVGVHDGEPDHAARRSQLALLPYALGQPARLREGVAAVAGNHVVIRLRHTPAFVALAHLRAGSIDVAPGEEVAAGQRIAACGNSGNSTQPHVHLQVMDGPDAPPPAGCRWRSRVFGNGPRAGRLRIRDSGLPEEGAVVEALPPDGAGG